MTISVKSPEFAAVCEAGAASAAIARWLNSEASSDSAVIRAIRTAWLKRFSLRCDMVLNLPQVTLFDGGAMLLWSPARQKAAAEHLFALYTPHQPGISPNRCNREANSISRRVSTIKYFLCL